MDAALMASFLAGSGLVCLPMAFDRGPLMWRAGFIFPALSSKALALIAFGALAAVMAGNLLMRTALWPPLQYISVGVCGAAVPFAMFALFRTLIPCGDFLMRNDGGGTISLHDNLRSKDPKIASEVAAAMVKALESKKAVLQHYGVKRCVLGSHLFTTKRDDEIHPHEGRLGRLAREFELAFPGAVVGRIPLGFESFGNSLILRLRLPQLQRQRPPARFGWRLPAAGLEIHWADLPASVKPRSC